MEQRTQIELVRRVLAHVAARTTDRGALPTTLDVGAYLDPDRFDRETKILFRDLPLAIAHRSTLATPGDFITHDASGVPLLVIRRDDGTIGAFLNVCRHRGTRVEPAPCGTKKAFSCPYHAWTYGRDGRLLTIPHERTFGDVCKEERGLVPVPAGEAAGLVWVRPSAVRAGEDPTLDPTALLGSLAAELESFGIATSHVHAPRSFEKALTWKLALDIFLEAYHLRTTHRDTIYPMFFDNLGLVDFMGPHLRNVLPKRSIRELPGQPEDTWELRRHANILYHLFPNTLVLVQPDHAAVVHVWPNGSERSLLTVYALVPEPPTTDKARAYWDANLAVLLGATAEDFDKGESIQRGLASGANREVVFGAFEHALAHFHRQIAEHVADSAAQPRSPT
jgi:phenylpropionate dioxygenase-like ring-hydroxylating dioxygenase large terminal subunit